MRPGHERQDPSPAGAGLGTQARRRYGHPILTPTHAITQAMVDPGGALESDEKDQRLCDATCRVCVARAEGWTGSCPGQGSWAAATELSVGEEGSPAWGGGSTNVSLPAVVSNFLCKS